MQRRRSVLSKTIPPPPYIADWTGTNGAEWPSQWTPGKSVNGSGTSTINNNRGRQTSEAGNPLVWRGNFLNMEPMGDQEILAAFELDDPTDEQYPNISWRMNAENGPGVRPAMAYDVEFEITNDQVSFYVNPTAEYADWALLYTHVAPSGINTPGIKWVRIRAVGSRHRVRWWSDGDPEPSTWQIDVTDATWATGKNVLVVYGGISNPGAIEWAYYSVHAYVPSRPSVHRRIPRLTYR